MMEKLYSQVIRSINFAFDEHGRNLTLAALQRNFSKHLAACAEPMPDLHGISLQYVLGRGDWKHKSSWLVEARDYGNLRANNALAATFCRRCLCTSNLTHMHWGDFLHQSWNMPEQVIANLNNNIPPDLPLLAAHIKHLFLFRPCAPIRAQG